MIETGSDPLPAKQRKKKRVPAVLKVFVSLFLLSYFSQWIYHRSKALPDGISMAFPLREAQNIQLWTDYTFWASDQQRHFEQSIFDKIFEMIAEAESLIVLDMFLFNDFQGAEPELHRALSHELTEALIQRKKSKPELQILVLSDPFNTLYGGVKCPGFEQLKAAGIPVVLTDLKALRDSNPSWSAFWRMALAWMGNNAQGGVLPSPVSTGKVSLRTYLNMLNFKANHRKTLVVDKGGQLHGLIASANPHDGSSAHGNVALSFTGKAAGDLLASELAVAQFSGAEATLIESLETALNGISDVSFLSRDLAQLSPVQAATENEGLQIVTESKILESLLQSIASAQRGDKIDISIFYFSHQKILKALLAAQARGVALRILLDPNKDAFGRKKNGVPNRQIAMQLHASGVPVRWCDTHGEQCHSKFLLMQQQQGPAQLILGSANYTRRNLDDYNLETSVRVSLNAHAPVIQAAAAYFERIWSNPEGQVFSIDYAAYQDESSLRYWQYRLMESSGWSTF